jgi:hypothetical protein
MLDNVLKSYIDIFRNGKNPHYTENMYSCGLNVLLDRSGHSTVEIVCFFIACHIVIIACHEYIFKYFNLFISPSCSSAAGRLLLGRVLAPAASQKISPKKRENSDN